MISYKAARSGVAVVFVEPRYTSLTCSRCLHLGVRPNQSDFRWRHCGDRLNAELNGAITIARRHDLPVMGRYLRRVFAEGSQGGPKRFVPLRRGVKHET